MELAFQPGDPVLVLAELDGQKSESILERKNRQWVRRKEQDIVDAIVNGNEKGHYHLLIGEKGTGKSSMLLEAMSKVDGEGVAMFDAHADLEIFRIRLGKALNYEFHEDYIGSLFSIKGPRDTTALLDIERAFNKLDKIALRRRNRVGRPLILIINGTHLLRDDGDGRNLLELIQQRAEHLPYALPQSSDTDITNISWVYERLKQLATRLRILAIGDLPRSVALSALASYRTCHFTSQPSPTSELLSQIYGCVGGRLTYLSRVAKAPDMLQECENICQREKTWFLNQCWILGEEMDDDVMDQQKYAASAMLLAKALVDVEQPQKEQTTAPLDDTESDDSRLPELPLHIARQIMTRADFIQSYDHINVFTIDSKAMVRADSVPMQNAFRQICLEPGFEEHLQKTLNRIAAIESLGRTREIVAKDLVIKGKRYTIKGEKGTRWVVEAEETDGSG
ncbi:MAG: hypothetical protein LQ340_004730 [Diploschistes diacapsis]|nr:MAG: hypothetical protein LQ340_004730 [Diploschistes diacapsis]